MYGEISWNKLTAVPGLLFTCDSIFAHSALKYTFCFSSRYVAASKSSPRYLTYCSASFPWIVSSSPYTIFPFSYRIRGTVTPPTVSLIVGTAPMLIETYPLIGRL